MHVLMHLVKVSEHSLNCNFCSTLLFLLFLLKNYEDLLYCETPPILQMRRSNRDNLGIIFLIFVCKHSCDPSLELSHLFLLRNKINYL